MSNQKRITSNSSTDSIIEKFDYNSAFQINRGILTLKDQEKIREAKVTIMGMFAGGTIAIILARAGFSNFTLIKKRDPKDKPRSVC